MKCDFNCYITLDLFTVVNMLMSTLLSFSDSTVISCFDYSKTLFFPISLTFRIINNCTYCAYKYGNWSYLKLHHILYTGENFHQCVLCKVNFLGTHITILTTDKKPLKVFEISVFVCIVCDFKCEYWCHLKPHLTLHISENPFHWHVCNLKALASCKTNHMLKTILQLSYNPIIFQLIICCTKCDYKYGNWSYLKLHHILHTGENRYQCVVCKVNSVVTHILNLTTDKRPYELFVISVFVCIICDHNGYLNYLELFLMSLLLYITIHNPLQLYFMIYYYKQCKLELILVNTYIFDRGR